MLLYFNISNSCTKKKAAQGPNNLSRPNSQASAFLFPLSDLILLPKLLRNMFRCDPEFENIKKIKCEYMFE